tara:strand:+ start:1145 stop:1384 length:240 start_codon:yes stop_codon:yes gene_type:complete
VRDSFPALKGGTAINLFVRNMPRLSVDIDLTYLPITDRNQSYTGIAVALKRIKRKIRHSIPITRLRSPRSLLKVRSTSW